jgi:hypothetical protein
MSLLRFLTVSHSFENVRDHQSPYRMTADNWLPRFGRQVGAHSSAVSPITAPVTASDASPVISARSQSAPVSKGVATAKAATGRWDLPPSEFKSTRVSTVGKAAPARVEERETRGRGPGSSARMCQGELWTDQVKPLRNDLRESDMEVAPARITGDNPQVQAKAMKPTLAEASLLQAARQLTLEGRNSLASKLFNVSRMLG